MGTRRSRHNKGRKPLYKEHRANLVPDDVVQEFHGAVAPARAFPKFTDLKSGLQAQRVADPPATLPTATELLASRPRYGGSWVLQGTWWTKQDEAHLRTLCDASAPLDKCADLLARDPKTLVHRARDLGMSPPSEWSKVLGYNYYKPRPRQPLEVLCYPYIRKARDEHADVLRVNSLVPLGLSATMRADVCQSILLAVLEGAVSLDALEREPKNVSWFIKKFHREQTPYQELTGIGNSDDDRGYDEIAAAAGAAWGEAALNERDATRDGYYETTGRFVQPTQIDDVYTNQIEARRLGHAARGRFMSWQEAKAIEESESVA